MAGKQQLKDPNVCRVFFSSPFLGMEKEREELTRLYFPQLRYLCASKGIQFAAVDMRWGITTESSQSAKTIDICLRELDRSDIFVGFFGQRYGWNGANDEALQDNFNVALPHFPWLDTFRDKSVTELEFLHGFLNNPGERPACVCYRDKTWDDKLKAEAEANGDTRGASKFTAENEQSVELMEDLKKRTLAVEDKCLAVDMAYSTPEEGAKVMFNAMWKYLSEELLVDKSGVELEATQQQMLQHDAICDSHCGLYISEEEYMDTLDSTVDDATEGIVVLGEPGVGKSALMSNWIKQKKEDTNFGLVLYHFIGFPDQSTEIKNIVNRMSNLINLQYPKDGDEKFVAEDNVRAGVGQFCEMLNVAADRVGKGKNVCIVVDGIEKLEDKRKAGKHLFWLPSPLPVNVTVIVSTRPTDTSTIEELVQARGYTTLTIEGLNIENKRKMCLEVLKTNSKELPSDQMEMIVAPKEMENPLYLKIVVQELCVVDYYRKIKAKIEHLLSSNNIKSLFDKFLERLELDYNIEECPRIVKDVVCFLYCSHYGLSEDELVEFLSIPSHIWVPLHFALDVFLLQHSGLLRFAYSELREAVHDRYLQDGEEHERYSRQVLGCFMTKYQNSNGSLHSLPMQHAVLELTGLLSDLKDWQVLGEVITDLRVFDQLYSYDMYMMFEYAQNTQIPGEELASRYVKALKQAVIDTYVRQWEEYEELNPTHEVYYKYEDKLRSLIDSSSSFKGREILLYHYQLMLRQMKMGEDEREDKLLEIHYRLAVLYVDMHKDVDAEVLFNSLLEKYERKTITTDGQRIFQGHTYHLVGVYHMNRKNFQEANKWMGKAHGVYSTMTGLLEIKANMMNNLGVIQLGLENYETAKELFELSIKLYQEFYFGQLPPSVGLTMLNVALCYRKQEMYAEAKATYERCLKITKETLGPNHPDVAKIYLNQGTIAGIEDNNEDAERLFKKAYEIFKGAYPADHPDVIVAQENMTHSLMNQEKWEEAEQPFWETFDILVKQDRVQHGLKYMQAMFVEHYYRLGLSQSEETERKKQLELAQKILVHILPHTPYPLMYHRLSHIDSMVSPDKLREPSLTLDGGIERFPNDEVLVDTKFLLDVATTGDIDKVVEFLNKIKEHFPVPHLYLKYIVKLRNGGCHDLAEGLAKYTLTEYPPDVLYEACVAGFQDANLKVLMETFTNTLSSKQDYSGVVPFIQRLTEFSPDDVPVHMALVKLSLMAGQFDVSRRAIGYITDHWADNEQLQIDMGKFTKAVDYAEEEMKATEQPEDTKQGDVGSRC